MLKLNLSKLRRSSLGGRALGLSLTLAATATLVGGCAMNAEDFDVSTAEQAVHSVLPAALRVFGQPDLKQTNYNEVAANRAFHPAGVFIDRSANFGSRTYVWDSNNNRVLGFAGLGSCVGGSNPGAGCVEESTCTGGGHCEADPAKQASIVFGQPTTSGTGACNGDNTRAAPASASSLCLVPYPEQKSPLEGPRGGQIAQDSSENIYLVDTFNNRVLKYNTPFGPAGSNRVADTVWGQADFTARQCNRGGAPSASTLCTGDLKDLPYQYFFTSSLDVTKNGNSIWVADPGNHRVLRFTPGQANANFVLGQGNFTSNTENCSSGDTSRMCVPTGIAYDETRNILYVMDSQVWDDGRGRILVFKNPTTNGQAATEVWTAPAGSNFKWPRGLTLEPTSGALWVNDTDNARALRYVNGAVTKVIGDCDLTPGGDCTSTGDYQVFGPHGSIGIDKDGALYLADLDRQRINKYTAGATPGSVAVAATTFMFDQPGKNDHLHANKVGPSGLANPGYVAFVGNQLVVADRRRIVFWNNFASGSLAAGNASGVLAQDDFNSQLSNDTNQHHDFTSLAYDDVKKRLYATHNWAVSYWDTTNGLQDRAAPAGLIDPASILTVSGAALTCTNTCTFPHMYLNPTTDTAWLADSGNHRLIRVTNFSSSSRRIDLILGQNTMSGSVCNRGAGVHATQPNGFCDPAQAAFDSQGNLYVVDGTWECRDGNCRVVQFKASDIPAASSTLKFPNITPERVFGPNALNNRDCDPSQGELCSPRWITFDPRDGSMVATGDSYANPDREKRLAFWHNPTKAGVQFPAPTGFLLHPMNQAGNVAINSAGQMAVLDHTWNRVVLFQTQRCDAATSDCADETTSCGSDPGCASATPLVCGQPAVELGTTGEKWYVVNGPITGWGAYNTNGRTIRVNGTTVVSGQMPLPAAIEGNKRYFQFTAGSHPWASVACW